MDILPDTSAPHTWIDRATPAPRARRIEQGATERIGGAAKLPALLRAFGIDPAEVFEAAGLPLDYCEDPDARIAIEDAGRLLETCTARTQCRHFALLAGRLWWLSDWGRRRTRAQLRNRRRRLARVQRASAPDQQWCADVAAPPRRHGRVRIRHVRSATVGQRPVARCGDCCRIQPAERAVRTGLGTFGNLRAAWPARRRPTVPEPVRAPLRFDAETFSVRFAAHWLERPVAGADSLRMRMAERALGLMAGRTWSRRSTAPCAVHCLPGTRRRLRRPQPVDAPAHDEPSLRSEGTTYPTALDAVRFAVATQLLCDRRISLDDIAANLRATPTRQYLHPRVRALDRSGAGLVAPGETARPRRTDDTVLTPPS